MVTLIPGKRNSLLLLAAFYALVEDSKVLAASPNDLNTTAASTTTAATSVQAVSTSVPSPTAGLNTTVELLPLPPAQCKFLDKILLKRQGSTVIAGHNNRPTNSNPTSFRLFLRFCRLVQQCPKHHLLRRGLAASRRAVRNLWG